LRISRCMASSLASGAAGGRRWSRSPTWARATRA